MALSTRIFLGLGLGVVTGVFFGESVGFLKVGGDAFVALLQMTVLPYILVSLVGGLGGLSGPDARKLGKLGGGTLAALWMIALVGVICSQLAHPKWESASFFSSSLVQAAPEFDILGQYIPTNLFFSLSSNIVPAVVVFSIALGIALVSMKHEEKATLVQICQTLSSALASIAAGVAGLAPYGVFAIMASVAGTLSVDEFERLQVYIFSYLVVALVLIFWVLPGLIHLCTPVSYKQLLSRTRGALITAFATGSVFVVLPLLASRARELVASGEELDPETESTIDVVLPTAMSFPSVGKLLTLSFVLFAGWLSGSPISLSAQPLFLITGLFSFFGSAYVAVPYLLNMFQIPADTFQLLPVLDNLVSVRFGTLLATMSILALTLITAAGTKGTLQVPIRKLATFGAISLVLLVVPLFGLRMFFEHVVGREYQEYNILVGMKLRVTTDSAHSRDRLPEPFLRDPSANRVTEIKRRGFVRVGYFADSLPFAFVNRDNELVGMDVQLAHILASELGVRVEFVRVRPDQAVDLLRQNVIDLIASGVGVTPNRAAEVGLTDSYMDENLAFVVKDHLREKFSSSAGILQLKELRIAVPNDPFYIEGLRRFHPDAQLIAVESPRAFFTTLGDDVDALLLGAEAGSAWTLVYPQYSVAVPQPGTIPLPIAFAVDRADGEFRSFLNSWIDLKKRGGRDGIPAAYEHWILGRDAQPKPPRWSIVRDILGWVE